MSFGTHQNPQPVMSETDPYPWGDQHQIQKLQPHNCPATAYSFAHGWWSLALGFPPGFHNQPACDTVTPTNQWQAPPHKAAWQPTRPGVSHTSKTAHSGQLATRGPTQPTEEAPWEQTTPVSRGECTAGTQRTSSTKGHFSKVGKQTTY